MVTADYTLSELQNWSDKIEKLIEHIGLDCYEQQFEICSYEDMLCYEAYVGMPSHYPHWSYGKAYERQKTFYTYNLTGLPYEMVINSDPCIAYLMRDNTLLLQILTIAHVYGHNDFFKNNRLFKENTRAELTVEMFKSHAGRVRDYIADPSIGPKNVERILDAAHALRFQIRRQGEGKLPTRSELAKEDPNEVPDRLKTDLLGFLSERGKLAAWEKDLASIVREESFYFLPQLETKIMNEGWASYWHYHILQQLDLPQGLYLEFLQRHNLVVRPHQGQINPYFIGFKMFEYLEKNNGQEKIFEIRAQERDQSFLRRFLNKELCEELCLFNYKVRGIDIVVTEVADEEGWKVIRNELANSVGLGMVPEIRVQSVENGVLILEHVFDGRELEMNYTKETIKYVAELWGNKVDLKTKLYDKDKIVRCTEDKIVSVWDA
ncbi:SpoVR family protein [Sporomusa acidovorans]|uniref:SpoVR family protein n=1 Tax=Sporomusa acidovorans (strain ATCC 49682 / DSM 3132 / Mol) TaxID=1123286 RepID=A0ABZ3IVT6_SPOA4|nr:SpoVR family protein [Sporomusa acidovorans]OZC22633.1 SpoVR family protein [Sporomusa acidovorans DSM 3132]SDE76425.1 stage V sporulation protein R [Sporomusa acidovorans]